MAFGLNSIKEFFNNLFDTRPVTLGLSTPVLPIGAWIEEKPAAEAPKAAAPAAPKAPN